MNIEYAKEFAVAVAQEAGKLLMDNLGKAVVNGIQNGVDLAFKTKQDDDSQALIIQRLREKFPEHGFLAEETKDHEIVSDSPYKWIIDPIDGTNNYIDGRDTFSISIGLEEHGKIVLGIVLLPKRNELFIAEYKKGATLNGEKIQVGSTRDLSNAVVTFSTAAGREQETEYLSKNIFALIPRVKAFGFEKNGAVDPLFGRGSMAAEFCYVACGRIDGLIRLKQAPWDVAAGSLIVTEAGATSFNLKGKEPSVYEGDYVAANPFLIEALRKLIL